MENTSAPVGVPSDPSDIEYLRGFKAIFNDPNFKNNILIGSVHLIIPIVGPMVLMGWYCEIMQRLMRRHSRPIPRLDFSDFGFFLGRGVTVFLVAFLLSLPMVFVIYFFLFSSAFLVGYMSQQRLPDVALIGFAGIFGFALILMVFLPAVVMINAAVTFAELSEDFGRSLDFSKMWAYSRLTWKKVLVSMFVYIPVTFAFFLGGAILCYIGIYPAMFLVNSSYVFLRQQIYQYALSQGFPPVELKPERQIPSEMPRPAAPPPTPPQVTTPPAPKA